MDEKSTIPKYVILPCNGLDKAAGCIAREVALELREQLGSEVVCPVLYQVADARYKKNTECNQVLVIDGCPTRCASKIAADKGLKIAKKVVVTEYAKNNGIKFAESLRLDEAGVNLAKTLVCELLRKGKAAEADVKNQADFFPKSFIYETYQKDKFIFRVPKEGFLFNENDCWAYVSGNVARVGVTDFVQQSLSDIIFCSPPTVGAEIEQFGELGTIESGKTVFELVSPVSGKIITVNEALVSTPELINKNPYIEGWIADIELTNFDGDKELLLDLTGYFPILKRKVEELYVK